MMLTKNSHMSYSDRQIIETAIENGSTKQAIATTLGKDKSTIGKEIKLHRFLAYKCNLPLECANYKRCKHERYCTLDCSDYVPFKCTRRDKSPGACNGCGNYRSCRYDKYRYSAFD
ncbi:MAG: helix-turn-helix domain-containing protein, partial [Solobacterium sp.]|nr:helix-turn-helix domain-containing protein [Solobacterium sp.]